MFSTFKGQEWKPPRPASWWGGLGSWRPLSIIIQISGTIATLVKTNTIAGKRRQGLAFEVCRLDDQTCLALEKEKTFLVETRTGVLCMKSWSDLRDNCTWWPDLRDNCTTNSSFNPIDIVSWRKCGSFRLRFVVFYCKFFWSSLMRSNWNFVKRKWGTGTKQCT